MYTQGNISPPNECDIFTGDIDYHAGSKTNNEWYSKVVVHGNSVDEVYTLQQRIVDELNGTEIPEKELNYAAAFNAWMDDYMNNPQAYEDSHDSAVRHLKEKLNGEEPSYGAVCAEVLVNYLNKLEQLALESK